MIRIYILFEGVNAASSSKVHGGGVFSRWIARELRDRAEPEAEQICVLWPKGVEPKTDEERVIYEDPMYHVLEVDSVYEAPFQEGDTLLIPILESCHVDLNAVKQKFPFLRITMVIHGMRNVDLARFDPYQVYYHKWYRPIPGIGILSFVRQLHHKQREIKLIRDACCCADQVYTDSNNSMQLIIRYGKPRWISYYHPASVIPVTDGEIEYHYPEKYTMLINANRNEKNVIRTLAAFCNYKKAHPEDPLRFYAVGVTDPFRDNLKKVPSLDWNVLERDVSFFGYVSSKQLLDLFRQCNFLLYPSKSEGYGLPALDAMEAGVPVVASRITSVPEVLGSAAYYVDPYSTASIQEGICFMSKKENNDYYRSLVVQRKPLVYLRRQLDTQKLTDDILGRNKYPPKGISV